MAKKVYDFPFEQTKNQVARAFRKLDGQGTVADVISRTGLAKYQVEKVVPAVVDECGGQLRVTDSSEVLYYFPQGVVNRKTGWRGFWKEASAVAGKVLASLFKIWIVVMLVGYFSLFLLLFLVAVVAAIALSFAKRDDRDSDSSGLGFYFVAKLFEWFILIWLYSGDAGLRRDKKARKPFYKAVFNFVFGVEGFKAEREQAEKKALISLIQHRQGLVTVDEVMGLTGASRAEADAVLSRFMLEFEGDVQVSEGGVLYYSFPELLKTSQKAGAVQLPPAPLIPFSGNEGRTNGWIIFFNAFNALFGGYYLYFGLLAAPGAPGSLLFDLVGVLAAQSGLGLGRVSLALILGAVPFAFSLTFFGIPLWRRFKESAENWQIKLRNFRRKLVNFVRRQPQAVALSRLDPESETEMPVKKLSQLPQKKEELLRELADGRNLEVEQQGSELVFKLEALAREEAELTALRQKKGPAFQLGGTVFDSGK